MLTLLDARGSYQLPTHWGEVSTAQYCDLDRLQLATVESRASYFAGRPIQVNGLVADALAWMLTPPQAVPTFALDLGQESFLQAEIIRGLLAQPLHEVLPQLWATYVARASRLVGGGFDQQRAERLAASVQHQSILFCIGDVVHCLTEVARLSEAFAELAEPDHTEAGRRARDADPENTLAAFGHLSIARHYAQAFGTTIDAIYARPWQEIALYMLEDRRRAIVQDRLQQQSRPT